MHSKQSKSVFRFLRQLNTVAFPILAATRRAAVDRRPTDRAAIDRYLLGGRQDPQQQTRSSGVRRPRGTNYDGCI